jgi:heterodisulfide reductase subunit C
MPELKGWPNRDATIILITEIVLMVALLTMNSADQILQMRGDPHYTQAGAFPVSQFLAPAFENFSDATLIGIERTAWWFHIIGILVFLNYVPYSKHWHIVMAFPNVYYTRLKPKGEFKNMPSVTTEIKLMMDPSAAPPAGYEAPTGFGVKDVNDLTWKNLMDAYACTECGRCTSVCPANITGKKLSPRKVMMDTRDRLEEVGNNLDAGNPGYEDGKNLHSYISAEELWACTTCNACVQACPVNIDPLEIIVEMRQFLVMEQSQAPSELNMMLSNVENNGAPWQMSPADRANWTQA